MIYAGFTAGQLQALHADACSRSRRQYEKAVAIIDLMPGLTPGAAAIADQEYAIVKAAALEACELANEISAELTRRRAAAGAGQ